MKVSFLSSVQSGAAAASTLGPGAQHATVEVTATFGSAGRLSRAVAVKGSGEIQGLDINLIRRRFPTHGAVIDAGSFAFVELSPCDLPWRYSPVKRTLPSGQVRVMPWLALVTLAAGEFAEVDATSRQPLRSIRVRESALPPAEDTWAWAHVQTTPQGTATLASGIDEAMLSRIDARARIMSPRRLRPNRRYTAFLVPVFMRGRMAGLTAPTEAIEHAADALAWNSRSPGADAIDLPYYDRFEFLGGESHDFASAVKSLRPATAAPSVGSTPFDASALYASLGAPAAIVTAARAMRQWGLLVPAAADVTTWPAGTSTSTTASGEAALAAFLDRSAAPASGALPLIGPPLRGGWSATPTKIDASSEPWFKTLNLDLGARLWAELGAAVVRTFQEELLADLARQHALDGRKDSGLSTPIMREIQRKHMSRVERLLTVAAPLAETVIDPVSKLPAHKRLQQTKATGELATATGRRLLRSRGAFGKRIARMGATSDPYAQIDALTDDAVFGKQAETKPVAWSKAELASAITAAVDRSLSDAPRATRAVALPHALRSLLRRMPIDSAVSGVGELPPSSISLWKTNDPAVAAFIAGATDELTRELAWRGIRCQPGEMYFERFWENRPSPDVTPPKQWTGNLGAQVHGAETIVALRCDVLARFPGTTLYALDDPMNEETAQAAILTGTFGADVTYFGFAFTADKAVNKTFVLQGPETLPWLGFHDLPENGIGWSSLPAAIEQIDLDRDRPAGPANALWPTTANGTASAMAELSWQRPVRVAFPGSKLFPKVP